MRHFLVFVTQRELQTRDTHWCGPPTRLGVTVTRKVGGGGGAKPDQTLGSRGVPARASPPAAELRHGVGGQTQRGRNDVSGGCVGSPCVGA